MFCFMLLGMLMTFPAGYPTAQGEKYRVYHLSAAVPQSRRDW